VSYKSLKEVYSENVVGKPVPPLPRQSVRLFIKEEDEAIKVYKQEADDPATLEGEVDKEYYDDVISPAITRGGNYQLAKIVKERLMNTGCYTNRNYNLLVDFLQTLNITLTEEIFKECERLFLSRLNQPFISFITVLAEALNANGQNITAQSIASYPEITELYDLLATDKAPRKDQSKNAGPGEVFIAFFANGKKLSSRDEASSSEETSKGDIMIGGVKLELKALDGRLGIKESGVYYKRPKEYFVTAPDTLLNKIKYLAFGDYKYAEDAFKPFESEVNSIIGDRTSLSFEEGRNIAGAIILKIYCNKNRLNWFLVVDKRTSYLNCVPAQITDNESISEILNKMKNRFYVLPANGGAKVLIGKSKSSDGIAKAAKPKQGKIPGTPASSTVVPAPIPAVAQVSQPQPVQGTPDATV